jgi:hypothetical protein
VIGIRIRWSRRASVARPRTAFSFVSIAASPVGGAHRGADERGERDDRVDALEERREDLVIPAVPPDHVEPRIGADVAQRGLAVHKVVEDRHPMAGRQQRRDQDRADVTGAARH